MVENKDIACGAITDHARACLSAPGQQIKLINRFKIITAVIGITRNRHGKIIGKTLHQPRGVFHHLMVKNTKGFLSALVFLDTVQVVQQSLRTPADPQPPEAMALRPVEDFHQFRPVIDLIKRHCFDRCTSDQDRVKELITNIIKPAIIAAQIPLFGIFGRIAGCCHQRQFNLQRRVAQQPRKLNFRFFLFRHQIEQQDTQWPDILTHRFIADDQIDVFFFQNGTGRKVMLNFDGHRDVFRDRLKGWRRSSRGGASTFVPSSDWPS